MVYVTANVIISDVSHIMKLDTKKKLTTLMRKGKVIISTFITESEGNSFSTFYDITGKLGLARSAGEQSYAERHN